MLSKKLLPLVTLTALAAFGRTLLAAPVTFSALQPIEPSSVPNGQTRADVVLAAPNGYSVFEAARFGSGSTQLVTLTNGTQINFTAGGTSGSGGTVANTSVGSGNDNGLHAFSTASSSSGTNQTTGNANFDTVLDNYAYDGNPQTITILGLTSGTAYQVSLFGVDNRGCCGGRTIHFYDPVTTTNTSATFAQNTNQFTVASFTASGSTQQIALNGVSSVGSDNLNALVVYQVPEPASASLLVGGLALLFRRRRVAKV